MAKLEDIPPTVYPDGSVIGNFDAGTNPPEDPEILHRPHAFALMHGDDGAKVAYGQLLWRIDQINIYYGLNGDGTLLAEDIDTDTWPSGTQQDGQPFPTHGGVSPQTNAAHNHGRSGQNVVDGLNAKVPTIDTEDGASMTSGINFNDNDTKYHQLDGYGDVYLYWKVDLDHADKVTKCWVTVDGTTAQSDIPAVDIGHSPLDRQTTGDGTNDVGTYRVKLGSVNEDAQVTQDISSDVHWSIFLLGRVNETGS
tara:strand:- start:232 stop:987 length:756 start_codon:yes stop_codon:yes gene_type:complete